MTTPSVFTFDRFVTQPSDRNEILKLTEGRRHALAKHSQPVSQPQFLVPDGRHPLPEAVAVEDKPSTWEEAWIDLGGEG